MFGAPARQLSILLLLLLSGLFGLRAQSAVPMSVALSVEEPEFEAVPGIANLIRESILLEMRLAGFVESAVESADVLVEGSYSVRNGELRFSFVARTSDGRDLFDDEFVEAIGLGLDQRLVSRAAELVEALLEYRDTRSDRIAAGSLAPEPAAIDSPPAVEPETEGQEIAAGTAISPPVEEALSAAENDPGFHLAADMGLFFAAGEAGRYFRTGYWPSLYAGYGRESGGTLGFETGVLYFTAEGYAAALSGLIVPFLPEFRYRIDAGGPVSTGFKLGAGAALMTVFPDVGSVQSKFIPAAGLGISTDFGLKGFIGRVSLDAALMYENGSLLYGFSPRVGVFF